MHEENSRTRTPSVQLRVVLEVQKLLRKLQITQRGTFRNRVVCCEMFHRRLLLTRRLSPLQIAGEVSLGLG